MQSKIRDGASRVSLKLLVNEADTWTRVCAEYTLDRRGVVFDLLTRVRGGVGGIRQLPVPLV